MGRKKSKQEMCAACFFHAGKGKKFIVVTDGSKDAICTVPEKHYKGWKVKT